MKIQHKLCIFAVITLAGIVLCCFLYLDSIPLQTGLLLLTAALLLFRLGLRKLMNELLLLSPFLIMVVIIYGIFAVYEIGHPASYWIAFGITRSALLVSSLFYMQLMLSWIRIEEIQELPLKIDTMKYLILGNLLYKEAVTSFHDLELYMQLMPSEQLVKRNYLNRLQFKLGCLLALLGYIISLATQKGEMIDEHITHCYQGDNK